MVPVSRQWTTAFASQLRLCDGDEKVAKKKVLELFKQARMGDGSAETARDQIEALASEHGLNCEGPF